jgi:GntR family transcriptional repressor for pyruvate dehydrogenase complex
MVQTSPSHQPVSTSSAISSRLVERVAERVEMLIAELSLAGGMRLPGERELGERFGVSRTVLREAVRILEQRGIVEVIPARGTFVASNGMQSVVRAVSERLKQERLDFGEFLEARQLLEVRVAELAAERRSEADLVMLRAQLQAMEDTIAAPEKFYEHDLEFHRCLAMATRNRLFPLWLQPITENLFVNVQVQVLLKEIRRRILSCHRAILAAVEAGDPPAAALAMTDHMRQFAEDTRLVQESDLF